MESTQVILKPLVTEKGTFHSSEHNRYTFKVDKRASKPQIKSAIDDLYGVRVVGVATQIRKGQMKRNRFGYWRTKPHKRAIVKVHPEDRIDLF